MKLCELQIVSRTFCICNRWYGPNTIHQKNLCYVSLPLCQCRSAKFWNSIDSIFSLDPFESFFFQKSYLLYVRKMFCKIRSVAKYKIKNDICYSLLYHCYQIHKIEYVSNWKAACQHFHTGNHKHLTIYFYNSTLWLFLAISAFSHNLGYVTFIFYSCDTEFLHFVAELKEQYCSRLIVLFLQI